MVGDSAQVGSVAFLPSIIFIFTQQNNPNKRASETSMVGQGEDSEKVKSKVKRRKELARAEGLRRWAQQYLGFWTDSEDKWDCDWGLWAQLTKTIWGFLLSMMWVKRHGPFWIRCSLRRRNKATRDEEGLGPQENGESWSGSERVTENRQGKTQQEQTNKLVQGKLPHGREKPRSPGRRTDDAGVESLAV